ncbi:MAG: 3-deoxy-D-manno-octulosonic acid transferase [Aeromonas sp.]
MKLNIRMFFCFILFVLMQWFFYKNQILTGDQTQMLAKGYLGAYQGIWQSYGNAASAMGNVPGSLSSLLIGVPLLLWDSPYAPMVFLLALRLLGYLLFDAVIKQAFGERGRLFFIILCWLNPWFQYESLLYNPSYLFLCSAMHVWSAWQLRSRANFWPSLVHILSIGMAMQLHYSWPLLAVISAFLFWRGIMRINWWGMLAGGALIAVSLIPYALEVMQNSAIAAAPDEAARQRYIGWGLVHVYPVLKSVLYWLRYGSWLFASKLVNYTEFSWLAGYDALQFIAIWSWRVIIYFVGGLSVLLAAKANWQMWLTAKKSLFQRVQPVEDAQLWLSIYAIAAVGSVLVSAALSPITFNYWHLMLVFPYALFPLLIFFIKLSEANEKHITKAVYAAVVFCCLVNLVAATDSKKFSYKVSYAEQVKLFLQTNEIKNTQ